MFTKEKKKELLAQIEKIGIDSVIFARVFLLFYDTFRRNLHLCGGKGLSEFLDEMDGIPDPLRKLLEELDDDIDIGNYYNKEKIKDRCKGVRRENMDKLIVLGNRIFLEEE